MVTKHCPKCDLDKDESAFYANGHTADGLDTNCKVCKRSYQGEWRQTHIEGHRSYSRGYAQEHAEERRAYQAAWREQHREYLRHTQSVWRREHPEQVRRYRAAGNANRRARVLNAEGAFTVAEWESVKQQYGNRCLACGRSEPEVKITPDHVVPLALGGSNGIDNIQPLCWGCNAAKQARIVDYRAANNAGSVAGAPSGTSPCP